MNRRSLLLTIAIVAIVIAAGATFWRLRHRGHAGSDDRPPGLLPLSDAGSFPSRIRPAVAAIREILDRGDEQPSEFYATVEEGRPDKFIVLHLWHVIAFSPENKGKVGNPGGRCRDAWFDPASGQVVRVELWQ